MTHPMESEIDLVNINDHMESKEPIDDDSERHRHHSGRHHNATNLSPKSPKHQKPTSMRRHRHRPTPPTTSHTATTSTTSPKKKSNSMTSPNRTTPTTSHTATTTTTTTSPKKKSSSMVSPNRTTPRKSKSASSSIEQWGHTSTPTISRTDLMGGAKNAFGVEKVHTVRGIRTTEPTSPRKAGTTADEYRGGAEAKIQNIMQRRRVKQGRRSDVKNSLSSFLQSSQNPEDDIISEDEEEEEEVGDDELYDDEYGEVYDEGIEDDSLISDDEEKDASRVQQQHRSPTKHSSFKSRRDDGNRAVDKSPSVSRRKTRVSRTLDKEGGGDSNHSRKSRSQSRSRIQRVRSKAISNKDSQDDDNKSVATTRSRVQRRRNNGGNDDDDKSVGSVGSVRRLRSSSRSRPRSVDAAARQQRHRSHSRGADPTRGGGGGGGGRARSRSKPRNQDEDDNKSVASRRHHQGGHRTRSRSRSKTRKQDDDDDKSVASRRHHQGGHRTRSRSRSKTRKQDDDDDKSVASRASVATCSTRRGKRPGKGPGPSAKPNRLPPSHMAKGRNGSNAKPPSPPSSPDVSKDHKKLMSRSMPSLAKHLDAGSPRQKKLDPEEASEESSRYSNGNAQAVLLQFDPTNADLVRTVDQSDAKKTYEIIRNADGTESKFQVSELAGLPTFEDPNKQGDMSEFGNASSPSLCLEEESVSEEEKPPPKPRSYSRPGLFASKSFNASDAQNPGEAPAEEGKGRQAPLRRGVRNAKSSLSFMQRVQQSKSHVTEAWMNRSTSKGLDLHQALDDDDGSDGD